MFGFFDLKYGRSSKWHNVRLQHLKDNPKCAACGRETGLEVHHIVPYNINPQLELDSNNLITLCDKYCHFVFGHLMDWKSWNSNVVEDCKTYLYKKQNRSCVKIFGSPPKGYFYAQLTSLCSDIVIILKSFWRNN